MKRSLRYRLIKEMTDRNTIYPAPEALELIKNMSTFEKEVGKDNHKRTIKIGFEESIEMHINLNLKAKHTIRDTIILPHKTAKEEKKILVFAKGEKAAEAEEAGADFVGESELIDKIKEGWFEFDIALATPDMMSQVGKIGRLLGTRGLMPNPKTGTVTLNIKEAINEVRAGRVEYRADKTGIIHIIVGRVQMPSEQIMENAKAIYQEVLKKKPSDLKGEYIRSMAFAASMSPGIKFVHQSLA